MTNEEAIKYIRDINICEGCNDFDRHGNDCERCSHNSFFELALKVFKERNKYHWHDLRKSPYDVPDAGQEVLNIYCNNQWREYHIDFLRDDGTWNESDNYDMEYWQVVAWRPLEDLEDIG